MAISKTGFMLYLTIVFANLIVFRTTITYAQCQGDLQGLIQQCAVYVQKQGPKESPSQGCCSVIHKLDLPCVCQHITPQIEQIISMEKAVYVAGSCGVPIPHGTKCGSYTVPPSCIHRQEQNKL